MVWIAEGGIPGEASIYRAQRSLVRNLLRRPAQRSPCASPAGPSGSRRGPRCGAVRRGGEQH
eukprot:1096316-Prymnesium_polylepis.2